MRRDCPIIEIDMLVIGGGNGGQPCSHGLASVQAKLPDHPVKTAKAGHRADLPMHGALKPRFQGSMLPSIHLMGVWKHLRGNSYRLF